MLRLLAIAQETPGALPLVERLLAVRDPGLAVEAFGLRFPNPVGLAAGLDKDARAPAAFAALGFGAVEVGTITPLAQQGNPRPRVFRLPEERALINRMGFPNEGAARARARLRRLRRPLRGGAALGVNLGKNAQTPLADAARDYVTVLEGLHDVADYAVVNVSSPNTAGLRGLQERRALEALLGAVVKRRDSLEKSAVRSPQSAVGPQTEGESIGETTSKTVGGIVGETADGRRQRPRVPILVKVAPDLDWAQFAAVVEAIHASGVDGIVATNTTLSRAGVASPKQHEVGGLSGEPLRARSTEIVRWLARETGGSLPIVGVGGIGQPDHALEQLDAGAVLVQVYTGLIYEGPVLPARICRALLERRRRH